MKTAELDIAGMDSGLTRRGVCSALNCIRGVVQVAIQSNASRVAVTYDAYKVSPGQFEKAVYVMGCEVLRTTVGALPVLRSSGRVVASFSGGRSRSQEG